jgi:hypothetical protein
MCELSHLFHKISNKPNGIIEIESVSGSIEAFQVLFGSFKKTDKPEKYLKYFNVTRNCCLLPITKLMDLP